MQWNGTEDRRGLVEGSAPVKNIFDLTQAPPSHLESVVPPSKSFPERESTLPLMQSNSTVTLSPAVVQWTGSEDQGLFLSHHARKDLNEQDSLPFLEEMAQMVKREAQWERQQIPPFVQKLSR